MSEWLVLSIAMASACAVVLTIAVLNNRRIADDDDPSETPDVIEYMTMMIGVVYAIRFRAAPGPHRHRPRRLPQRDPPGQPAHPGR
ncbi:hypothetical protein ABZ086_36355 [Streptomyces halstedii]